MTEQSMFFADGSYYSQTSFAKFIKDIFNSGVVDGIDNELAVSANSPTNMAVQVKTGRSYVRGFIHEITTNPVQLTIATAHASYARIDRVVLHLDTETDRSVTVQVKTGTPASSPSAPSLTQTDTIWEISLAQVRVNANATVITSANITDERTFMTFQEDNLPELPIATTSSYGLVKVGSGITLNNGVISIPGSASYTVSSSTNAILTFTVPQGQTSDLMYLVGYNPGASYSGSFTIQSDGTSSSVYPYVYVKMYQMDYTCTSITISTGGTTTVTVPSGTRMITVQVFANYASQAPVKVFFKVT